MLESYLSEIKCGVYDFISKSNLQQLLQTKLNRAKNKTNERLVFGTKMKDTLFLLCKS